MKSFLLHRRRVLNREAQSGYIMIAILLMLALMVIAMTVAAPKIAQQVRREREVEMIHRGTEYARAVKKYHRKFNAYPASIEQLENTNGVRFLRKKYTDPMNPEGAWRIVRFGEIQIAAPMNGASGIAGNSGNTGTSSSGSTFGSGSSGGFGSGSTGGQTSPPIVTTPGEQPMPDPSAPSGTPGGTPSAFGNSNGQAIGGGAMMGVSSMSKAKGIHEFNNKAEYEQWYFVYVQAQDRPGLLLRGPYNPKALFGGAGSIPGALNPNQLNQPSQQQQQQQQLQQNNNSGGTVNR